MFGFGGNKGKGKDGGGRPPFDGEAPAGAPGAADGPGPISQAEAAPTPALEMPPFSGGVGALTPDEALQRLRDGNRAFLTGEGVLNQVTAKDLAVVRDGQQPFAVIIGCADSRAAPTLIFNQGLGRLFIVRVAGNTIDRRGLASVVYAVKVLKCPLVVVLGHTGCGAVAAAEAVVDGVAELDTSLDEMITPIIPAVLHVRSSGSRDPVAAVEENAVRVAERLRHAESALVEALEAGSLKVVAAVKDLHTGEVRFLER